MEIVACASSHREAVGRFNDRLAVAGSEWSFPFDESTEHGAPSTYDSFLAVENDDVYGGYLLRRQLCFVDGEPVEVGSLQLPLSLGQVDSAYGRVSVALLIDAIRRAPYLYALGLGSEDTQFARLLSAAGWPHVSVPFYFSVKSANRFAREIRLPPGRTRMQAALRLVGRLRLARPALAAQRLRATGRRRSPTAAAETREVARLDERADALFDAVLGSYAFVGDRRSPTLDRLYGGQESRFLRVAVERGGTLLGWAILLDTQMADDKYFGDLRVGTIVDCFAAPDEAEAVVRGADGFLERRGVDVVVSNQLHAAWCRALEAAGYQHGPSNFFFYCSEQLASRLRGPDGWRETIHVSRGDGEGPGHL